MSQKNIYNLKKKSSDRSDEVFVNPRKNEECNFLSSNAIFNIEILVKGLFNEIIRLLPHTSKEEANTIIAMLHESEFLNSIEKFTFVEKIYGAMVEIIGESSYSSKERFIFTPETVYELCETFSKTCSLVSHNCENSDGEDCTMNNISILAENNDLTDNNIDSIKISINADSNSKYNRKKKLHLCKHKTIRA